MPEILRDAGYFTTMSGKWHLGLTPEQTPHARGFQRSFALLPGGANHFAYEPRHTDGTPVFKHWASLYYEDDRRVETKDFPKGYYSSDYFTTKMIEFLREKRENPATREKPFFSYLAFTAPHWPLQAPPEIVKKYGGWYEDGPDALRKKRLERQIELGLLKADVEPHPVETSEKEWNDMTAEEKMWSAKTMSIFAAMVERMDWNIGRVFDELQASGELGNTFILFMSDNGAEGAIIEAIPMTGDVIKKSISQHYDNSLENLGNGDSFIWYGPRWAQASTAPSRMFKGYVTEGGIRCPAIIHYPPFNFAKGHQVTNAFSTVMDILPTILDLSSTSQPGPTFHGRDVVPIKGKSWVRHLSGQTRRIHDSEAVTGWELFFHQAIRKGNYKAVFIPKPKGPEKWQLYDLSEDMGEIHDLAEEKPEILSELVRHWLAYVAEFGVFLCVRNFTFCIETNGLHSREELDPDFVLPKQ